MSRPSPTRPPDLVRRDFTAARPNQLWVVDFTCVPTWSGMAFTAFVFDVFSRRIVGWRTATRMPTESPLDALEMACYSDRLTDAGAVASIGTVGDSFDNSLAESVNGLYKAECLHHEGPVRTIDDLALRTLTWVQCFTTCA